MTKPVTLTIDGQTVTVPQGTLVVDAAKKAGVYIPVFCYHPKMEPVGMCRMCLVEIGRPVVDRASGQVLREADGSPKIQFGPKLETACTVPVSEGMAVRGFTDPVKRARKDVLEFLLTSHPLDCPICDKGGECPLQNLTMDFGPGKSRFLYDEKYRLEKHLPLGELIYLDRERCIQCGRCVRFQDEVVDDPVIAFAERGRALQIVTYSEPGFASYFSGNTTDICPVGALTTADFRFGARPWEMTAAASICQQCPVGCNLTLNVRREHRSGGGFVVKRVMPRQNEWVNELWICDKGRFAYHYAQSPERLSRPLVRKNGELAPATWEEALSLAAERFREAGAELLTIGSGRLSNEDLFNLRQLTSHLGGQTALYSHMAGGDLMAQVGVGPGTNLSQLGPDSAILVVASDLEAEAPIYWLRVKQAAERGATLIVANPRPTKLERYASHSLRYAYGSEAATVLGLVNALSPKKPDTGKTAPAGPQLKAAAQAFAGAANALVFFGSEGLGLAGSQSLAQACANLLIATGHTGKPDNGLIGVWSRANEQGAWELGFRPPDDLASALAQARAAYIVAADPFGDDPALGAGLEQGKPFLVVQELFLTATAQLADVVLPAQSFIERAGSSTNGERRVQRFYGAVPPRPEARPDYAISAQLGACLGLDLAGGEAEQVMERIAQSVPAFAGISYHRLAQVTEQWPLIGRADLYYGGTSYENKQGLGVQLPLVGMPVLSWPTLPAEASAGAPGLLGVPITRLYDRGLTVSSSLLLQQRIGEPTVLLHPADALAAGAVDGAEIEVQLNSESYGARAQLSEAVPPGVVLVPRSMGIPISQPAPLAIRAAVLEDRETP